MTDISGISTLVGSSHGREARGLLFKFGLPEISVPGYLGPLNGHQ